jgi:hypothetical protein
VQEKKLAKMNLTTNKQSSQKMGFSKHTITKTYLKQLKFGKKNQYKVKI